MPARAYPKHINVSESGNLRMSEGPIIIKATNVSPWARMSLTLLSIVFGIL